MCKARQVIVCAMGALACTVFCHNVVADTAYVRVDGDNGSPNGDGTGWGQAAYKYLQDGLTKAAWWVDPGGGDYDLVQVWVAATAEDNPYRPDRDAEHHPEGTGERDVSFQLVDKVELYGGFAGNENALSERNIYKNVTVLCGDLAGDDDDQEGDITDNSYHVVEAWYPDDAVTARIDGFTIRRGNADGTGGPRSDKGGGMCMSCSNIGIINCTFTSNCAGLNVWPLYPGYGGAICVSRQLEEPEEEVNIINCVFAGNLAKQSGKGGAAYITGLVPTVNVVNSLFAGNTAGKCGGPSGKGGSLLLEGSGTLSLTNCTIVANTAAGPSSCGGGIASVYKTTTGMDNCILWGNSADDGNQIWIGSGSPHAVLIVTHSDVSGGYDGIGGYPDENHVTWEDNIDDSPVFCDYFGGNYRLQPTSPCRDLGDQGYLPQDDYDLDNDGVTGGEQIPYDITLSPRVTPDDLEAGSYEICLADLTGPNDIPDGIVNAEDLLFLLGCWGTPCGDVDGDNDTDTADLLYLLGTWGCGNPEHPAVPQSIQDCMQQYGLDPVKLEACIEAMIRAGTP